VLSSGLQLLPSAVATDPFFCYTFMYIYMYEYMYVYKQNAFCG
jgi:hypothetical protein